MVQFTSHGTLFDLPTEHYTDFQHGGRGAFGTVIKAKLHGKPVAIKRVANCLNDVQSVKRLIREVILLRSLKHRNIIRAIDLVYPRLMYSLPPVVSAPTDAGNTDSTAVSNAETNTVKSPVDTHDLDVNLADNIPADIVEDGAHLTISDTKPQLLRAPSTQADNESSVYIVTAAVDTDLYKIIRSTQTISKQHIQWIMYQLISSMEYMHTLNVLHRDIKPSNILIDAQCNVWLCDFGLGRVVDDIRPMLKASEPIVPLNISVTGDDLINDILGEGADPVDEPTLSTQVGSRWYRAPEIYLAPGRYGAAADMWSVGTVLGELLGRQPVFQGRDNKHQLECICQLLGKPSMFELDQYDFTDYKAYISSLNIRRPQLLSSATDDLRIRYPFADEAALDLLSKLVVFDPAERLTAQQALQHPYFAGIQQTAVSKTKAAANKQLRSDLLQFSEFESDDDMTLDSARELFEKVLTVRGGVTEMYKPLSPTPPTGSLNGSRKHSTISHDSPSVSTRMINSSRPGMVNSSRAKSNGKENTIGLNSTRNQDKRRHSGLTTLGVDLAKLNIASKTPAASHSARMVSTKQKGSNMFESFRNK